MGGKDVNLHSKWVEKMQNYTPKEWKRCKTTLETGGEDVNLHSKRVGNSRWSKTLQSEANFPNPHDWPLRRQTIHQLLDFAKNKTNRTFN
jgi:hypothetical protein